VTEGYDRASTNRIATAAGVGIGSLYQYFPSKDALVAGVAARHAADLLKVGRDSVLKAAAQPIEVAVRALVEAGIEAHRVDPKLHRVLAEESPQAGRLASRDAVEDASLAFLRGYLEAHRDELGVTDLDLSAFVLATTIEALTHAAVLRRPDLLAGEGAAAFADDVSGLLLRYLKGPPPNDAAGSTDIPVRRVRGGPRRR
jgi:AcrR family transcriptional regulator